MEVEIWSDIACPWCYVGKRRFEAALAQFEHRDDAHRLVHLAGDHGLQDQMKERLLAAYFAEGQLMSDHDTLVRLAVEVGLAEAEVRAMLASDRYAEQVRDDERTAHQFGITAVPTFVLDRALGASGAHPPKELLELLRQGWANRPPLPVVAGGEACGVDGC
jgi:predicted DsbA family dithiol-disulfide isomerase